jgi:hypothetical protein
MAYYEFLWLDTVREKLADRGIETVDVEAIVRDPYGTDTSNTSGLPVSFGWLPDGRYVIVVYKRIDEVIIQVYTCYEVREPRA